MLAETMPVTKRNKGRTKAPLLSIDIQKNDILSLHLLGLNNNVLFPRHKVFYYNGLNCCNEQTKNKYI